MRGPFSAGRRAAAATFFGPFDRPAVWVSRWRMVIGLSVGTRS